MMDNHFVTDYLIRNFRTVLKEAEIQFCDLILAETKSLEQKTEFIIMKGWVVGYNPGTYKYLILVKEHNFSPSRVQQVIQPFNRLVQKPHAVKTEEIFYSNSLHDLKEKKVLINHAQSLPDAGFKWISEDTTKITILKERDFKGLGKMDYFKLHI